MPEWLVPLGRTIGVESNGAVSNLAPTPFALTTLRKELRAMRPDVIHVHEPPAPTVGYDVLDSNIAPIVGTFHCYSENAFSHGVANNLFGVRRKLQRLHVRIAVSEAAAWTGRRFYGGRYRVIPNGVDVPDVVPAKAPAGRCGWRSSARPSSARGCRCCCAPSRRCASTSRSSCS
jgi:phosphatidylinositol alpha-mannosyltransferase